MSDTFTAFWCGIAGGVVLGIFVSAVCIAVSRTIEKPCEITNEDIQKAIKEGYFTGYEAAKAKFESEGDTND